MFLVGVIGPNGVNVKNQTLNNHSIHSVECDFVNVKLMIHLKLMIKPDVKEIMFNEKNVIQTLLVSINVHVAQRVFF